MSDTKISALPTASALAGTEPLPVVQSSATKQTTPDDIATYVAGAGKAFVGTSLTLQSNISSAAWTTNGVKIKGGTSTLTDTSSSGTVAAAVTNALGGNTIAASNSTTFTDYYSVYVSDPVAGTNVTLTNKWSFGTQGGAKFGGTVTAPNLAGGRTLRQFTPLDNQPPASAFATLDTRNSVATLDFDDTTVEGAVFVGVIPEAATLTSGIKARLFWAATTATSGSCKWGVSFEKFGTDIDADSFDTEATAYTTASGTSGIVVVTEITATAIDSLVAGDQFRLKVRRIADDGTNDTMSGDAELIAVELRQVA